MPQEIAIDEDGYMMLKIGDVPPQPIDALLWAEKLSQLKRDAGADIVKLRDALDEWMKANGFPTISIYDSVKLLRHINEYLDTLKKKDGWGDTDSETQNSADGTAST